MSPSRARWTSTPAGLLAACAALSCVRTAPPSVPATPPDSPAAVMPGPYRRRLDPAAASNARCVECHAREAAAWGASRHARAFDNTAFQSAFAIEPSYFCQGCHAPESAPAQAPTAAVARLGVGCVSCHVTDDGAVLAAPERAPPTATSSAPHPLRRSAAFAGPAACAACHEFRFPLAQGDADAHLMQTTVREHARSPAATAACASCHMPLEAGHRSHAFAETRSAAWLRAQLAVTAERAPGGGVRITLAPLGAGHAFPTGDLFRRLEVGCAVRAADGAVIARDARYLARHFVVTTGSAGRTLARDDRVQFTAQIVDLAGCRDEAGRAGVLSYWVTYQRVASAGTGVQPERASIESQVVLYDGVLP